ncbi:MAG: hypothetical protein AAF415_08605 [Pseudomonadota bacterium]
MHKGAIISGAMHGGFLLAVVIGTDWFRQDDVPFVLTEVDVVDGTEFDAMLSTAPIVPNEGPADLSEPAEGESAPSDVATPSDANDAPEAPELLASAPPPNRPDLPDLSIPPPPTSIPTEAPVPSIAEVPSPDVLPDQAATPESPPSTEPVQPLATQQTPQPAPQPTPPPEPEPELAAEEPKPEPEETEPAEVAETQPDAPLGNAPLEAKLPVARDADKAAVAIAAAEAARKQEQQKQAEAKPTPAETETTPKPQPEKPARAAGGSKSAFAQRVTRGEKDALRLGIKRHFVYSGARERGMAVVIAIRLDRSGKITGKPSQLRVSGGSGAAQQALFRAGSRALRKAEAAGEFRKLPANKYDAWKLIHVTFTPDNIGFAS